MKQINQSKKNKCGVYKFRQSIDESKQSIEDEEKVDN